MIENIKKLGYGTATLIILNLVVFVVVEVEGWRSGVSLIFNKGGMYPPAVLSNGEWYRLLTACFLHFDATHLMNNMLMLGAVGRFVERHLKTRWFVPVYLLAGISGNVVSLWIDLRTDPNVFSAGASGAVLGMVGALLAIALRNGGRVEGLTARRILFMIALCLFAGLTSSGINNAAHVGGLVSGFVLTLVLYRPGKDGMKEKNVPERAA